MPLQPCDPFTNMFACGLNTTSCLDNSNTFKFIGGTDIILRDDQVTGQTVAVEISPTMTSTALGSASTTSGSSNGSGRTTTVTVTSTAGGSAATAKQATNKASINANQYSAADVAGAAAGAGVPLLLALVGAVFVIMSQRKKLRRAEAGYEKPQSDGYQRTPSSAHAAPFGGPYEVKPGTVSPSYAPVMQQSPPPAHGHFREMVPMEMGVERERQELDGAR